MQRAAGDAALAEVQQLVTGMVASSLDVEQAWLTWQSPCSLRRSWSIQVNPFWLIYPASLLWSVSTCVCIGKLFYQVTLYPGRCIRSFCFPKCQCSQDTAFSAWGGLLPYEAYKTFLSFRLHYTFTEYLVNLNCCENVKNRNEKSMKRPDEMSRNGRILICQSEKCPANWRIKISKYK